MNRSDIIVDATGAPEGGYDAQALGRDALARTGVPAEGMTR
ncbi:hypothetical protein [Candidatus Palauibacter sp.]